MTLSLLISLAGVVSGFVFAYIGYQKGKRSDSLDKGQAMGSFLSDIGYIKAGIDDLKREQRETGAKLSSLSERLCRCEESAKQAHKRIAELTERINSEKE